MLPIGGDVDQLEVDWLLCWQAEVCNPVVAVSPLHGLGLVQVPATKLAAAASQLQVLTKLSLCTRQHSVTCHSGQAGILLVLYSMSLQFHHWFV